MMNIQWYCFFFRTINTDKALHASYFAYEKSLFQKRKDTDIILPANFKRFYKKIEAYFRLTLLVNLISLNFPGRIRSQIHTWVLLFVQIYAHSKPIAFYFGSAPFLIECARQMMRTKSLSVTKMAAPMELFWEWKKLPITCWISIFYLLVSQQIYIFSKSADVCFEISPVGIDNSHVIKMGVLKQSFCWSLSLFSYLIV